MIEEVSLGMDAFFGWDGFSENSEDALSATEKSWMVEFPMQMHHQTSSSKTDALSQDYINCLLIQQVCEAEKLADKITSQANNDHRLVIQLDKCDRGFVNFDDAQRAAICLKASNGGVSGSGEVHVTITFGGGRDEAEVSFGGSVGINDNQGNSVSVGVEHDPEKKETTVDISAEVGKTPERPGG